MTAENMEWYGHIKEFSADSENTFLSDVQEIKLFCLC